jgi:hypothetical protein
MSEYIFFKYRPVNKFLFDSIVKSAIYFPNRTQLNDPFDCNVDIVKSIENAIKKSDGKTQDVFKRFLSDEKHLKRFRNNVVSLGIGSFSLTHMETLLWSHYANDHKGIVLRYDFPAEFLDDENHILGVAGVSYKPNAISNWLRENIRLYEENHFEFITGLLKKVLMSKAPSWAYEQEARIVRPVSGLFEIPRQVLTHVVFGLQTSQENESLIRAIVGKYYDGVRFGRAIRTSDDFGIEIVEI